MPSNLILAIGNTPLVKIPFNSKNTVYTKLEYLNPGGSLKDRSALFMIEEAEKKGVLKPGATLIDASSGNHGIALAMIGAYKGYKVIITASEKISTEKLHAMQAYGATIVTCPSTTFIQDAASYHSTAKRLVSEIHNAHMPNQYFNPDNARAHYTMLGPEIWVQTQGTITHFFAATGTGGTISGAGKFLKEKNRHIKVVGVDAHNSYYSTKGNPKPYALEGIGIDFDAPLIDHAVIDEIIPVTDQDAFAMIKRSAQQYGIMGGMSSGAVAHVAAQYMQHAPKESVAVMIFGDSGRAYLSKNIF